MATCRRGHVGAKRLNDGTCVECKRLTRAAWTPRTDTICKNGHVNAKRYKNGGCIQCVRDQYYAHPIQHLNKQLHRRARDKGETGKSTIVETLWLLKVINRHNPVAMARLNRIVGTEFSSGGACAYDYRERTTNKKVNRNFGVFTR